MRPRAGEADILALAQRAWGVATERFGPLLYGRVDVLRNEAGDPEVLELELLEPSLFLDFVPGSAEALAAGVLRRAGEGA
jgi:O-ureido-D-serine cyclo-ligase